MSPPFCASRQSGRNVLIALDGKTLRGTIPTGHSQGVHLLAAYLPAQGIVLVQMAVENKENEIVAAPKVLASLDLRGKIVMGDAMQTQRELSVQIIEADGDYIWLVKDNQPTCAPTSSNGLHPKPMSKASARSPKTSRPCAPSTRGTAATRSAPSRPPACSTITSTWPGVAQVFKLERRSVNIATGEVRHEVVYGITSLTAEQAPPKRLISLIRQYWGIENGLHYRRDKSLHEDATRMRNTNQAQNLAAINNLVVGLLLAQGWRYLPEARRHYGGCLPAALNLVFQKPG